MRLKDGKMTTLEKTDSLTVKVHASNMVPDSREATGSYKSHMTATDDGNAQGIFLREQNHRILPPFSLAPAIYRHRLGSHAVTVSGPQHHVVLPDRVVS